MNDLFKCYWRELEDSRYDDQSATRRSRSRQLNRKEVKSGGRTARDSSSASESNDEMAVEMLRRLDLMTVGCVLSRAWSFLLVIYSHINTGTIE